MVKLRLARVGAKKKPFHRLVATDSRNVRNGRFLEILGVYSPSTTPKVIGLKEERVFYWLDSGAQMSDTVRSLLKDHGSLIRWQMRKEPPVSEEDGSFLDQEQVAEIETMEEGIGEDKEDIIEPEASNA